MAESIFDLIYGTDRFKKPQTGLMSSFDDTDYGDLTAKTEKDYLDKMLLRDKIALLTSPYPVVGGITGTYADMMNMIENPEERTKLNAGLMALNWIPSGRVGREIVEKTKDMIPDPRFRKRKSKTDTDQKLINELTTETEGNTLIDMPEVSVKDLVGRPVISSMADRTMGGKIITHVNGVELNTPIVTRGGDQFMQMGENVRDNRLWSSDPSPVGAITNRAEELRKLTGQDPLFAPFKMAPSSNDYSHQTLEMMLNYNDTVFPRNIKSKMNKAIKEIDPDFVGVGSPKIQDYIYKTLSGKGSGKKRKAILNMLDRDFREIGGLSLPEARVAVSDTAQLSNVDDASLRYVGEITGGRMPISNHPTYAQGIEGQPVGVLKEKNLSLLDLLDDADLNRGLTNPKVWSGIDRKNIDPKDMYVLRTSPKSGIITEEKLRNLEELGLLDQATKTAKPKESGVLANITTKNADEGFKMQKTKEEMRFPEYEMEDFILQDNGRWSKGQAAKIRMDDYQEEAREMIIKDKKTGKEVGRTVLTQVPTGKGDKTAFNGLIKLDIKNKKQGTGQKFIENLKKSAKADPTDVDPTFKIIDVQKDAKGFWDKVGGKKYYRNQDEIGGTYGIQPTDFGASYGDKPIPAGILPEEIDPDTWEYGINTILDFSK